MKTHLTNRASRLKNQARRLLCERLERRYALHAMPWGYELFDDSDAAQAVTTVDSFATSDEVAGSCNWGSKGLKAEGEDFITGNRTLDGERAVQPSQFHGFSGFGDRAFGSDWGERGPAFSVTFRANLNSAVDNSAKIESSGSAKAESGNLAGQASLGVHDESLVNQVSLSTSGSSMGLSANHSSSTQPSFHAPASNAAARPSSVLISEALLGSNLTSSAGRAASVSFVPNDVVRSERVSPTATPDLSNIGAAIVKQSQTIDRAASTNLFQQATSSYNSARALSANTAPLSQLPLDVPTTEQTKVEASSDESAGISSALQSVIESLAQEREVQRNSAARHASESGWDDELAHDAIARAHRDVIHDDGLLELATLPERMANTESLEPYAAIEGARADRLSMTLVQVGSIHEFELAGEHLGNIDLIANPEQMLTETTGHAVAAVDQWHAGPQTDLEAANETIDSDISVLNRSALPLSFLALGGMLIASRRRFKRKAPPAPNRTL